MNSFTTFLFIFCALLALVSAAVNVDSCRERSLFGTRSESQGSAVIDEVRVNGCTEPPCKLRRGSSTTIEFDFKPDKQYESLTTSVFGGIGIIRVPFREVHGVNACNNISRKRDGKKGCPLEANEEYTYSRTFPIQRAYPPVSVNVQYGLNEGKNSVICFSLPTRITSS